MKKHLVIILLLASSSAFAQHFELGAKAGANISNFTGHDNWQNAKTNSLVGYHLGGFVSFFIGKNFAIQPELLYSSQGAKFESAGQTTKLKVNYINIPVILKLRTGSGFYIEAGPQVGFKTSESSDNSSIDSLAKSSDLSIAAGFGFHSKIGLGIGARYTAGLSKVGDFKPQNGITPDYKNGVFQISIFYTLFRNR